MSDLTVKIDDAELKKLLGAHGPVGTMLARVGVRFKSIANQRANDLIYSTPPSPNYVRTGRYRQSLDFHLGEDAIGPYVDCGSNVEYADYLELGTVNMAARPIIVPAAREAAAHLGA